MRRRKNIRFRPSKEMRGFSRAFSVVYTVVALFFVYLGVTQLIPSGAGAFGFLWTGLAACFAGFGIYGIVSKDGLYGIRSRWGVEIEDEESPEEDAETRLKKLQSLYDQRMITTEEYEAKRKEILKEL